MTLNIYDSGYLLRVRKLQIRRNTIVKLFGRIGSWSKEDLDLFASSLLGSVNKVIRTQSPYVVQNHLSKLFDRDLPLIKRLKHLSREFSIPILESLEFPFWVKPSSYPPATQEMRSLIVADDVISFISNARKVLKDSMLEDFIELQAALMKSDQSDVDWLVREINSITLQNYLQIEPYRELYSALDFVQRTEVVSRLRCHSYIRSALTRKAERGVILDGSNIFMLRGKLSDLEFILEKIATNENFYYPFWVVFDRNIVHLVSEKASDSKWFSSPSVFLHSPADELILRLAKEKNAVVVSSDRFRQWHTTVPRIDPRRLFE
ncbi:MAG TPA: hypothetical protein PLP64_00680 [Pseudothermotoga sp.]|nr:hypothetical protein [Pseudothermotoga sp.]HOK82731.1 hypothetical protein [Pseudothermotoga sp.]HPP70831.1 hypothetical protein [Pseudothermotoga sp.]